MFQPRNITADTAGHSYFPLFDYIRALAVIGVFLGHAGIKLHPNFGNACVQVFFALSGFLIGEILLRTEIKDLPRFYFNRSARIWIPYAFAIGLVAIVTAIKQGFHDPKFAEFFAYMATFTYNWFGPPQLAEFGSRMPLDGTANHFWSICVEEQFYLIAPFVILFLGRRIAPIVLAAIVILNFVHPHDFAAISLGVLLALAGTRRNGATLAFVAAFTAAVVATPYSTWMPFMAVSIIGLASTVRGSPWWGGEVLGGASFSFYLNHWVGLFVANALMKLGVIFGVATIAGFLTIGSACVAHYLLIDRNIQRFRSRWYSPELGTALCAVGFALVAIGLYCGLVIFRA